MDEYSTDNDDYGNEDDEFSGSENSPSPNVNKDNDEPTASKIDALDKHVLGMEMLSSQLQFLKWFCQHAAKGETFLKHERFRKPRDCIVSMILSLNSSLIKLECNNKRIEFRKEELKVLIGKQTPNFTRSVAQNELCFSIVTPQGNLDLEAKSAARREFWTQGFHYLPKFL